MLEQLELSDSEALDAEWCRCQRTLRTQLVAELVQAELAVGVLVVVALCGIFAITHTAVASGAVAVPLGLGLAVTLALVLHGLAWRARMSYELSRHRLFRLECARRNAAERAKRGDAFHPYRTGPLSTGPTCAYCLLTDEQIRRRARVSW